MIADSLRAEGRLKAWLTLALSLGVCVPYFGIQHLSLFPSRPLAATRLDDLVPFQPEWTWVYQSLYLFIPVLPFLARRKETLIRYAKGLLALSGACFVIFLLFPVAGPRPHAVPGNALYSLLVSYDAKTNAFPSLHAGLMAYSLFFGWRLLKEETEASFIKPLFLGLMLPWGAAILYATVATKQHYVIDLPFGVLLAWLAHGWAWKRES